MNILNKNIILFINGGHITNDDDISIVNDIYISDFFMYDTFIQDIPPEILNGSKPTNICINRCYLTQIPPKLKQIKKLFFLDLSDNQLTDLCELPISLISMYLNQNKLEYLPEHLSNLVNLEILEIKHNLLTEVPNFIKNLINLNYLNLSYNKINFIYSYIDTLTKIEELNLSFNEIQYLPNSINKLQNLNSIDLSCNKLIEFPDNCERLFKLKKLFLSNNSIMNIDNICEIKSLEEISLNGNQIFEVPDIINNLENLVYLNLSENNISNLPNTFNKCKKLHQLCLSNNFITDITNICKIKTLESLSLYNNQIFDIPNTIFNLENLIYLNLSENCISNLPKTIIYCTQLKELNLSKNRINQIPFELFDMLSNLDLLDLRDNPIIYPIYSTENDITKLKSIMGDKLLIDDNKISDIYDQLNSKPIRFNFVNFRQCKPSNLPTHIYTEQELIKKINEWKKKSFKNKYNNKKIHIIDPNEFTQEVISFDTTILINYIHHLYNPEDEYHKWKVPNKMLDDFKKYIGAIVYKLFTSNDNLFVEGHLNSLSIAICYCTERHKNEMIFLYELLVNENYLEKFEQNNLNDVFI